MTRRERAEVTARRITGKHHAHISTDWLRDADNPEDFYDYIGEWRRARRRRDLWLVFLIGAVLGGLVGLAILIFAVVR